MSSAMESLSRLEETDMEAIKGAPVGEIWAQVL